MSQDRTTSVPQTVIGTVVAPADARFALVASRFNSFVVDRLIDGALDALVRHGVSPDAVTLVKVPGSWELPAACARLARGKRVDGIVALSAVIRGGTPHFEYVAAEVTKGLAALALETGVPLGFGVLTTDTIEQAIDRAGTKAGNKGADAALAMLETVSLFRAMTAAWL